VAAGVVAAAAVVVLAADGDVGNDGCGGGPEMDLIFFIFFRNVCRAPLPRQSPFNLQNQEKRKTKLWHAHFNFCPRQSPV
jgi:hypothetical protein